MHGLLRYCSGPGKGLGFIRLWVWKVFCFSEKAGSLGEVGEFIGSYRGFRRIWQKTLGQKTFVLGLSRVGHLGKHKICPEPPTPRH